MAKVGSSPRHMWNKSRPVRILVVLPFPDPYTHYVIVIAHAVYDYNGSNADELPFSEGDQLTIVDRSDADWWKAEQGGVVFIVPAAYLAVADG